jgi:sucrose-6-phosphate hydrolase SacC (GH32 family)
MRSSLRLTLVLAGTLGVLGCGDRDPTGLAGGESVGVGITPTTLPSGRLTKYSGNPLVRNGPTAFDYWKAGPRVVLKEAADTYRMWYEAVGSGTPSITSIAYATSTDGLTWAKQGPQIFPTLSWEGNEVSPQSMLVENGVYRLWYHAGGILDNGTRSGGARIGYATSTDGRNWIKYPTPVLAEGPVGSYDDGQAAEPRVIKVGGEYRMYYTAEKKATGKNTLALATSRDGVNWTKYASNPVISEAEWGDFWGGAIFYENGIWHLWHAKVPSGIHYKWSNDGIAWTNGPNNPVLLPDNDPNSPTSFVGDSMSGYKDGDTYRIMFTGFSGNLFGSQGRFEGISLATIMAPATTVAPATTTSLPPSPSHGL